MPALSIPRPPHPVPRPLQDRESWLDRAVGLARFPMTTFPREELRHPGCGQLSEASVCGMTVSQTLLQKLCPPSVTPAQTVPTHFLPVPGPCVQRPLLLVPMVQVTPCSLLSFPEVLSSTIKCLFCPNLEMLILLEERQGCPLERALS